MNYQQLTETIRRKKSFLCIGLDSDIDKLPAHLKNVSDPVFEFNKAIIDATAEFAVAYKPNTAFYEKSGVAGWIALEKTIAYIKKLHPDIFIIADAKRGDIGNTSKMYADAFFKSMNADAVTVAPYMGEDSVNPFLSYPDKWVILLALTSNKGADDFQFTNDSNLNIALYEKVLRTSMKWANKNQMMYVVGATRPEMFREIRKIVPEHFLLVPGIGAQGGELSKVCEFGMTRDCGLLINSSRAIIFASANTDYADAARSEAQKIADEMKNLL